MRYIEITLSDDFKMYETAFINLINKKALICYKNTDENFDERNSKRCEHEIVKERKPTRDEIKDSIYYEDETVVEEYFKDKYTKEGFDVYFCTLCNSDYFKEIDISVKEISLEDFYANKEFDYMCSEESEEMYGSGYYDDFQYVKLCDKRYLDKDKNKSLFSMCWKYSNDSVDIISENFDITRISFKGNKIYLEGN